jgi:tetrapyrrole methylase family protein/MazG family protein
VNLARWNKVDAESALRGTNNRFRRRFKHIERRTRQQERDLTSMTLNEMDVFWEEAKENDED